MKSEKKRSLILGLIFFILLTVLDQITKYLAVINLKDQEPFTIIKNVFILRYLENNGAAFSILQNQRWFFIILTTAMLILVAYIYYKLPMESRFKYLKWICVALEAGALGNLIDRIRLNYVVDFFYFKLINFPTFNVADIYITCSMFFLIILILFYYKDDELEKILKGKK